MTKIKQLTGLLLILIAIFVGAWTVQDNPASQAVILFGFPLPELPLGVWLLAAFLVGAVLCFVTSWPSLFQSAYRLRHLRRQLENCAAEIDSLKAQMKSASQPQAKTGIQSKAAKN